MTISTDLNERKAYPKNGQYRLDLRQKCKGRVTIYVDGKRYKTVELKGDRLKATINGELVQDIDLSKYADPVKRHDGTDAPPVKDRPRKGHIGFQHLSRDNEPIAIRNAKIKELK